MDSGDQLIGIEPSPYSVESLSISNTRLLQSICYMATSEAFGKIKSDENTKLWDGQVLRDYISYLQDEQQKIFKNLLSKNGINYAYYRKMNLEGIGKDKSQSAFCFSAEAQEIPLKLFLKGYIQNCIKIGFDPKGFIGHEKTIESLLETEEPEIQSNLEGKEYSMPLLQDIVTINNEIVIIKQNLNYYPYEKNKLKNNKSKHHYEIALHTINELLKSSQNNIDLLAFKVSLLSRLNRKRQALKISSELFKKNDTHLVVLRTHAGILGELRKYEESLDVARNAQNLHPNIVELSYTIGVNLERLGKYEKAIEEYRHAVSLDKNFLKPYYRIAFCYHRLHQFKQSEAALKAALHIAPDNNEILFKLALNLSGQGRTDEAVPYLQSLLKNKDTSITSTFISAFMELKEGHIVDAEKILKNLLNTSEFNAFETKESKSRIRSLLAIVYERAFKNNPKDSKLLVYKKECNEGALEIYPENSTALAGLAETSYLAGEYENTKNYLDQLGELINKPLSYNRFKSERYINLSHFAKEENVDCTLPLKWCVEKYDDCINCHVNLAQEYIASKYLEDAKSHIEKALEISEITVEDIDFPKGAIHDYYLLGKVITSFEEVWPQQGSYRQKAKELFNKCSTNVVKDRDISLWLLAMDAKAELYLAQGKTDNNIVALNEAIGIYKILLKEYPRYKHREEWIYLNNKIGIAFGLIGLIDNDINHLETEIKYNKNILQEVTVDSDRERWSSHVCYIAEKLAFIGCNYSKVESLMESIELFQSVLNILNKDQNSILWSKINNFISEVFMDLDMANDQPEKWDELQRNINEINLELK